MQYFHWDHRLLPAVKQYDVANSIPFGQIQSRKRFGWAITTSNVKQEDEAVIYYDKAIKNQKTHEVYGIAAFIWEKKYCWKTHWIPRLQTDSLILILIFKRLTLWTIRKPRDDDFYFSRRSLRQSAKLNIDSESPPVSSCQKRVMLILMRRCKALIIRVQKNQDLSGTATWAGSVQQKKSFQGLHSGKAIYKRNPESLSNIVNLANLSIEESDQDMAKEIWTL
jgi:hypothetical protein